MKQGARLRADEAGRLVHDALVSCPSPPRSSSLVELVEDEDPAGRLTHSAQLQKGWRILIIGNQPYIRVSY